MDLSSRIGIGLQAFSAGIAGRGQQFIEQLDKRRKEAMAKDAYQVEQLLKSGDVQGARELLIDRIENIERLAGDPSDTLGLLNKLDGGDLQGALADAMTVTTGARQAGFLPKLERKFDKGQMITFDPLSGQVSAEAVPGFKQPLKRKIVDGQVITLDPVTGEAKVDPVPGFKRKVDMPTVKSSEILGDGTVVMTMSNGTTKVVDAEGNALKGKSRVKAIREARKYEAEQQRERAEGRTLGTDPIKTSIKLGEESFKKIDAVRKNINNLDRVVAAIDKGAGTGVFERVFPSVKAATIELENLRNRLGLDVVGDVTFGALSESELALALDTALPTNMSEQDLREWAIKKKKAQEVYAKELEKAASFFSRGGNIADYIQIRKSQKPAQQQQSQRNITVDF